MAQQYQVLARKYRPKDFSQLLGQEHVATALANAIDTSRLHHAYLFTGTRGVGKTTIARILAKCLNCETGVTSQPCGACDTCQRIDAGQFIDLIEIDAASRTKVEDTRDLLENVPYSPVQGRYKIYLIDEVHMLSTHSFNALLKTLEEPPEHVKFVLATTDPQKLPITIISRCLQFVLRPLSQELLVGHLANILNQEQITHSKQALWRLSNAAKGSVRDALSLTDQAIAFGGGQIDDDTVVNMLGLINQADTLALIELIHQDDRLAVADYINTMRSKMIDASAMMDTLIDDIHQMAMMQILPELPLDLSVQQQQKLQALSNQIPADVLQLYYEILSKSRQAIALASTPMQALEMAILRLLAFRPLTNAQIPVSSDAQNSTDGSQTVSIANSAKDTSSGDEPATMDDSQAIAFAAVNSSDDFKDTALDLKDDTLVSLSSQTNPSSHQSAINPDDMMADDQTSLITHDEAVLDAVQSVATDEQLLPKIDDTSDETMDIAMDTLSDDVMTSKLQSNDIKHTIIEADESVMIDDASSASPSDDVPSLSTDTLSASDDESQSQASSQSTSLAPIAHSQMMARLAPMAVAVTGDWTPEIWDYWLHLARQNQIFDIDELALLDGSLMVGEINGESTLYVAELNSQVQTSFDGFANKIAQHYPDIKLTSKPVMSDDLHQSPRNRREQRLVQLRFDVQSQLTNSPVIQQLWQQGFIIDDGTAVLNHLKLNINNHS
ncbi:DNA polymerase III subunit gamma/tau [Moraxella nasicaprae]|uniref:DNA polymerase III subunit gamma/tau n=1 Tax=Moraxella nasicaprae TaxID=2904122 RepID=A0ABY6F4A2_9GAMM|nr:DNA polymerase III subunit gamma/tau [Moraxella nasicaprae]UXZ04883.1 DNA polymerase III subunit gamma/tau [Moraxella nasicaprae]